MYRHTFILLRNKKDTLLGLIENYITSMNEFDNIFVTCIYGNDMLYLYLKCISCFVNVLLNNYPKLKSNKINEIKIQKNIVHLNKIS